MNSYEYDTTMECRDNGVLCGVVRGRGKEMFYLNKIDFNITNQILIKHFKLVTFSILFKIFFKDL